LSNNRFAEDLGEGLGLKHLCDRRLAKGCASGWVSKGKKGFLRLPMSLEAEINGAFGRTLRVSDSRIGRSLMPKSFCTLEGEGLRAGEAWVKRENSTGSEGAGRSIRDVCASLGVSRKAPQARAHLKLVFWKSAHTSICAGFVTVVESLEFQRAEGY